MIGNRKYNIFTVVCVIVGTVIGSGIFFKTDNILVYTDSNVLLGALAFAIAGIGVIFGSLSIGRLALLTDNTGGTIAYYDEFINESASCAFGWFQALVYYPTITVVCSWVAGIYTIMLFGWKDSLELEIFIGLICVIILTIINIVSYKLSDYLQKNGTIIKLIPLVIFAIAGFVFGDPSSTLSRDISTVSAQGMAWIAAIAPIAYSFEGWIVGTAICNEVKDAKKNMPRALVISALLITIVYILYFSGLSFLIGSEEIMAQGDASVYEAATRLFGDVGSKIILIFVDISVIAGVNGMITSYNRIPYSLAKRNFVPGGDRLKTAVMSEKFNVPVNSALLAFVINVIWIGINYLTQKFNVLPNTDVSEISIITSYIGLVIMYITVVRLARQGRIQGWVNGYLFPIIAISCSMFVLVGGLQNPSQKWYMLICIGIAAAGYIYCKKIRTDAKAEL